MKLFLILQNPHQILLHPKVNFAVAVEGAGVLNVTGDLGDEVGGHDFFVDVADQNEVGPKDVVFVLVVTPVLVGSKSTASAVLRESG